MNDIDARGDLAGYFAPSVTDLKRAAAEHEGSILGVM
jgi:hypothetical protein